MSLVRPTRRGLAALTLAGLAMLRRDGGETAAQGGARAPWQTQVEPMETAEITVGDQPLTVELATAPETRARGLGYRQGLAPGTGMLFVFPESSERGFWMKGMRFCLDIIWINDGVIVGAAESVCPEPRGTEDADRQSYPSGAPVQFVLEVPAGWLAEHDLGPGTPVGIPDWVTTAN
ncbi:MAG: DUF192 domain-containing protein [Chloroflexota bacterium]|nr:DUF192 domain-containing protein [Chloroflexota bacterium]